MTPEQVREERLALYRELVPKIGTQDTERLWLAACECEERRSGDPHVHVEVTPERERGYGVLHRFDGDREGLAMFIAAQQNELEALKRELARIAIALRDTLAAEATKEETG